MKVLRKSVFKKFASILMQIVANASEFCLLSRDQCETILFFFAISQCFWTFKKFLVSLFQNLGIFRDRHLCHYWLGTVQRQASCYVL